MERTFPLCWLWILCVSCHIVRAAELVIPVNAAFATCAAGTEYYDETILGCKRCTSGSDGSTSPLVRS